jgi:hypothetical protein
MEPIKKKRCRHCRKLFSPDPRNATRQEYCHAPECRNASKAESQKRWISKPGNENYFCGSEHVQRVQQWRKDHPGYWRRKSEKANGSLQETLNRRAAKNNMDTVDLPSGALQDILSAQHVVLLGLIANFTGSALQDDISITVRRLLQLGQDIVNNSTQSKGGHHGTKTAHIAPTGPPGSQAVQLA